MSYESFVTDPEALELKSDFWAEIYLTAPDGSEYIFRTSWRGTKNKAEIITVPTTGDVIAAHTEYPKRLVTIPLVTTSMWGGSGQSGQGNNRILTSTFPKYERIQVNNDDRGLDFLRPQNGYVWANAIIKVFHFNRFDIGPSIKRIVYARVSKVSFSLGPAVSIEVTSSEKDFDIMTSDSTYRGTSFALELSNKKVAFGTSPSALNLRSDLTIIGWLYLDIVNTSLMLFYGWNGASPFRLVLTTTRQIGIFGTIAGVSQSKSSTKTLSARIFYHIAIVINGKDVMFVIWDDLTGVQTIETYTNVFTVTLRDTQASVEFVCQVDAVARVWFDEFCLFNTALTIDQIESYRFRPVLPVPSNCVHRIGFDDGAGTAVTDSANVAHGVVSGAGSHNWLWVMSGGPELAGSKVIDTLGKRDGINPVLVGAAQKAYQVGLSAQSIIGREGGAALSSADHTTLRDFILAAPGAGTVATFLTGGLYKYNTTPLLPPTASVEGSNDGGYVSQVSTIVKYFAVRRTGYTDPDQIETASFTTFATGFNPVIGMCLRTPKSVRSALDACMLSGGGWWGFADAGSSKLSIGHWSGPALTVDRAWKTKDIIDIVEQPFNEAIWQVIVNFRQNDLKMTEDQIAESLKAAGDYSYYKSDHLSESASDRAIQTQFKGKAITVTFDTGIYERSDANDLAWAILALIKGQKVGLKVTLRIRGTLATLGSTESYSYALRDGTVVMGVDGVFRYLVVSISGNLDSGTIIHEAVP